MTGEAQEGFSKRIKAQQAKQRYLLFRGQEIQPQIIKNYRLIKKNILRAKQAEELKAKEEELSDFYKCKVISK